ncbi:glutamate dehydrogenase [Arthrobacter sp. Hiyo4]|nr:glutamate dehydrogenase [Arthrobacter sp. Hiyo4]
MQHQTCDGGVCRCRLDPAWRIKLWLLVTGRDSWPIITSILPKRMPDLFPEALASRAETHRSVAANRQPGQAKVSIVNEEDSSVVYVVTDDMPFLVDSVNAELVRQNAAIGLVLHPLFVVTRNRETGQLVKIDRVPSHIGLSSGDTAAMPMLSHLIAQGENASHMESWIAVEINRVSDEAKASLLNGLDRILGDVRAAVEDWPKMRNKAQQIAASLDQVSHPARLPNCGRRRIFCAGSTTELHFPWIP